MGVGEEKQIKGIFNRIIVERFTNLKIKRVIQAHETYRSSNCQNQKETPPNIY
jgi:hypothetical protein